MSTIQTTTPAWTELAAANHSLDSWERSAASAGKQGLHDWAKWMLGCAFLRGDIHHALPTNATPSEFTAAWKVATKHLTEVFDRERRKAFPPARRLGRR